MTIAPLDPARHRDTRVGPFPDFSYARQQQHAILGSSEIMLAAADYPLVLMKHVETGQFNVVALLGFTASRNLFVAGTHWHATYLPQNSLRYPFMASDTGVLGLALDERSELIGDPAGRRLFDDAGHPTDYTVQIADAMQWLRQDFAAMQELVHALTELSLVRPLAILLRMADATELEIQGLYSISDQALESLPDRDILMLHRRGFLRSTSVLMASLSQLNRLQQLHNAQSSPRVVDIAMKLRE
jgi:SapC